MLTLSPDQDAAMAGIRHFFLNPNPGEFILRGFAGTGKSTLVTEMVHALGGWEKAARMIDPEYPLRVITLTATTNKACESLQHITGEGVSTIHSILGLRPSDDGMGLYIASGAQKLHSNFLVIDEANFLDDHAIKLIRQQVVDCKILWIGDPAQLAPVKSSSCPIFEQSIPEVALTQVMRQALGNPIIDAATVFREAVVTGNWGSISIDNKHIRHVSEDRFQELAEQEMTRKDWKSKDSKILAWRNVTVRGMNDHLFSMINGRKEMQIDDYMLNNKYATNGQSKIKTDEEVCIQGWGKKVVLEKLDFTEIMFKSIIGTYLVPDSMSTFTKLLKRAEREENYTLLAKLKKVVDLRPAYALTVNKSQGSTYDKVFIDLEDIGRCASPNHLARLLYVAFSRARHEVIIKGDI